MTGEVAPPAAANPSAPRPFWLWPVRFGAGSAALLWRMAGTAGPLTHGAKLAAMAAMLGLAPLALCWALGVPGHRWITALGVFPFFLALLRDDRLRTAAGFVGSVMVLHSLLAVSLALRDQDRAAVVMPGTRAYLENQLTWIRSGYDPEYEVAHWAPHQTAAAVAVGGFSYTSLGVIPLVQGIGELDLMNGYVAGLIRCSRSGGLAVAAGWHLWSILRGFGHLCIIVAATAWSLRRLAAPAGPLTSLRPWFVAGLLFHGGDALLKSCSTRLVRDVLYDNMIPGPGGTLPPES